MAKTAVKRKSRIWIMLLLLVAAFFAFYAGREKIGQLVFERAVESNAGVNALAGLPDGLHLGLCGTGSPLADPERAGPCSLVLAGKQMFIIDAGGGAVRRLGEMRIPTGEIDAIFLTHFHSDHIDGLGELMLQRWAGGGHAAPVPVYGGEGVAQIVDGLNAVYAADKGYRVAHHGEAVVPPAGQGGEARPFALAAGQESAVVYDKGGVRVTTFRVAHEPVSPAYGYRFDYGGRSVVISGDTAKSQAVARACNGCDILLHEALNAEMVGKIGETLKQKGQGRLAKIMADIPGYHTSPVQAAEIASTGKAQMLVLTHIVPQLPSRLLEPYFLRGASNVYRGQIILGQDGMLFMLPANGKDIEQDSLF